MNENWARLLDRAEIQFDSEILDEATRGKRLLITGAGGSIGTALSQEIAARAPARLVLLDGHEASLVHLRQRIGELASRCDARFVLADLRDQHKIAQVFARERIDTAFHLAAYKQVPLAEDNVDQVASVNLLGTLNVLDAATASGTSTLVFPSSDKAVTALGAYAATKRILEQILYSRATANDCPRIRIVRLVNVTGTQGSVIEKFVGQARARLPLTITDSRMDRYWMTMAEAVHLLLAVSVRPRLEGLYMLDVGDPVSIVETARRVYQLVAPDVASPPLRLVGIRPGEQLHEELKLPDERFRFSELPGLLVIETHPSAMDISSWLEELAKFRERGYDWEPSEVKAWLLRLASTPAVESLVPRSTRFD